MSEQNSVNRILDELKSRAEIENVMGRYAALLTAGRYKEILEILWTHKPDRTIEEGAFGVYGDIRLPLFGMDTFYNQRYGMPLEGKPLPDNRGRLTTLSLSSPVIDVFLEKEEAVGSWMAVSTESRVWRDGEKSGLPYVDSNAGEGQRHMAFWAAQRYHVIFRREEGKWVIVHLHIWDIFRAPYNMDWVEYSGRRHLDDEMMDAQMRFGDSPTHAIYPTTMHWQYTALSMPPGWKDILEGEEYNYIIRKMKSNEENIDR